jgi:integrase
MMKGKSELSFQELVQLVLQSKTECRPRTLAEYRQHAAKIIRLAPEFAGKRVRDIGAGDCSRLLRECWSTASSRNKARRILLHMFELALAHGFIVANPLKSVEPATVCRRQSQVLTIAQVKRLLHILNLPEYRCCAAAVGIMLWAGIRSAELARLRWQDVQSEQGIILVNNYQAKGIVPRQVKIQPVLSAWLRKSRLQRLMNPLVVPRGWERRWQEIRRLTGLDKFPGDVLRRTFAVFHILRFHDFDELEQEMSQSQDSLRRLKTEGISAADAELFWNPAFVMSGER